MNQELKNRLIGAAVVTALATIFVPMLFDDPVDNSGQSVSELNIPAKPVKSTEISANKLPTPAKTPDNTTEESANPEEVTEAEMLDDPDAEATAEPPVNESTQTQSPETVAEAEQPVIEEEAPLDTGVIPAAKPVVKKPVTKSVEAESTTKVTPVIKKVEGNIPKLLPATKPIEGVVTKPVAKKPETIAAKPTSPATPKMVEKPAKNPELVRWTILAGSFSQKDNASTLMKSLREQGIPVVMETSQSAKGPIYRLKVGPELDKKKAAANKAKLDKQGVVNVMISE
jgi:DedD protein